MMGPEIQWYKPNIGPRLKPVIEQVYQSWSDLGGDELATHLHNIRDRAWPVAKYPCVGQWMFLLPSISTLAEYQDILQIASRDATILDMGCCFGQNLRLMAAHGVPTERMYATDIHRELWDLGFELFKDSGKMHATFIQADIFDQQSNLARLDGSVDIFIVCQFLHLFDWEGQLLAIKRIVKLSRPGAMIMGYQRGQPQGQECERPWGTMYLHNVETFRKIWHRASLETGTSWTVNASLVDLQEWGMEEEDVAWMPANRKGLNFIVKRSDIVLAAPSKKTSS